MMLCEMLDLSTR